MASVGIDSQFEFKFRYCATIRPRSLREEQLVILG